MGRGKTSQSRIRSTAPPRGEFFVPPQLLRDSSPGRGKMSRSDKRGSVAANAVSRRKGYHGKRLCLRASPTPMKKYTQIAYNTHIFKNICIKIQIEPKEKRNGRYVWQFLALTENPRCV